MNTVGEFLRKYGTYSASMVIDALVKHTTDEKLIKAANEISTDLEDVLVNANCSVDVTLSELLANAAKEDE